MKDFSDLGVSDLSTKTKRLIFPVTMSAEERELFSVFAKTKGWSLAKLARISIKTFIFMDTKRIPDLGQATIKASILDAEGRVK